MSAIEIPQDLLDSLKTPITDKERDEIGTWMKQQPKSVKDDFKRLHNVYFDIYPVENTDEKRVINAKIARWYRNTHSSTTAAVSAAAAAPSTSVPAAAVAAPVVAAPVVTAAAPVTTQGVRRPRSNTNSLTTVALSSFVAMDSFKDSVRKNKKKKQKLEEERLARIGRPAGKKSEDVAYLRRIAHAAGFDPDDPLLFNGHALIRDEDGEVLTEDTQELLETLHTLTHSWSDTWINKYPDLGKQVAEIYEYIAQFEKEYNVEQKSLLTQLKYALKKYLKSR